MIKDFSFCIMYSFLLQFLPTYYKPRKKLSECGTKSICGNLMKGITDTLINLCFICSPNGSRHERNMFMECHLNQVQSMSYERRYFILQKNLLNMATTHLRPYQSNFPSSEICVILIVSDIMEKYGHIFPACLLKSQLYCISNYTNTTTNNFTGY